MNTTLKQVLFTTSVYVVQALYLALGSGLILLDGVMMAGILRDKALRKSKEYVPLGALALCDALNGYRLLATASYRLSLNGWTPGRLASSLDCLLLPQNFFVLFAVVPLQPVMFTVLSLDRLIAVACPLKYLSLGMKYGLALSGGAYILVFLFFLALVFTRLVQHLLAPLYVYDWSCVTSVLFPSFFRFEAWMLCWTLASTVCSLLLLVTYWWKNKTNPVVSQEEQVKRQIRITKTVGLSCLLTFVLYALPSFGMVCIVALSSWNGHPSFLAIAQYFSVVAMSNSLIQPILVMGRLKELRLSVGKLPLIRRLTCLSAAVAPTAGVGTRSRASVGGWVGGRQRFSRVKEGRSARLNAQAQ